MQGALVSLAEASTYLGVSKATLRNWDRSGKLRAVRHPVNDYRAYRLSDLRHLGDQLGIGEATTSAVAEEPAIDAAAIRRRIGQVHDVLRDTDGVSNLVDRFDEITKLVFCESMARREQGLVALTSPSDTRAYYADLVRRHQSLIPDRFATMRASDAAIEQALHLLNVLAARETGLDVAGMAYEEVIRNTFDKGDHQQFFTPEPVVDFMVSVAEPWATGAICDPASGTGGFLAKLAARDLPYESLTGLEIDDRLAWVTGINVLLHGGHDVSSTAGAEGGSLGANASPLFGRFDLILTNPPFGSDTSDPAVLGPMVLGRGRSSRRRGILFLERCFDLLRDQGHLVILIDEGVLSLPHAGDVRAFLRERFAIEGIVALPETTFMPYATVNTSVLLLQKHGPKKPLSFFAQAEKVGRRPNGDPDIRYGSDGTAYVDTDLPAILRSWNAFNLSDEPDSSAGKTFAASAGVGESRLDARFHHPSRAESLRAIEQAGDRLVPLMDLCDEPNNVLVPAKEAPDSSIWYTSLSHIQPRTGAVEQHLTPTNSLKSSVRAYSPGDILFARMRPNLRKVAFVQLKNDGFVSPECSVLRVRRDEDGRPLLEPEALACLLRSEFVYGQIMHLVAGIGRPRISQKELRQVLIPVPPESVRAAIAREISSASDRLRAIEIEIARLTAEQDELHAAMHRGVVHRAVAG